MIALIDCALGNLRSVANALDALGQEVCVVEQPGPEAESCSHLILPGVGSYATAALRLQERGFRDWVRTRVAAGTPVLGICLGMQLLSTTGEEGGAASGLDLIPGQVARLDNDRVPSIPHVGWNGVEWQRSHPVLRGVKTGRDFYFVHSYRYAPADAKDILGLTDCGEIFPAVVARGSVLGVQFHPEKSQANGLKMLENFCAWDGTC